MRSFVLWFVAVAAVVVFVPTARAYGYLDPGTGSFLLQILVAGLLGILLAVRIFRDRIMIFLRRLTGRSSSTSDDTSSENNPES